MADNRSDQNNELVLNQIQFAYVLDTTKGIVNILVGPTKQQVAITSTERPVRFNTNTKRFDVCSLQDAAQDFVRADESSYVVLDGTTEKGAPPDSGKVTTAVEVNMGRKIVVSGPKQFPLWPGQIATVIKGHDLKTNEYLVCRVYNADEANKNWSKAIMQKRGDEPPRPSVNAAPIALPEGAFLTVGAAPAASKPSFVTGQIIIIQGTDVAFFIPPTGVEVLVDQNTQYAPYVRSAVTLEKLDYCILLNESGHKRYVQGPKVVFPEPTEVFHSKDGARKFKAFELNEQMGLHIKVIEAYGDFKEGDELFITGKEQPIYFPRKEHSIISYGDRDIQYSVAIPAGEGRYVLDKPTGSIGLVMGPKMFLPDPRTQVIVRRILTAKECDLYYPGNTEVLLHNQGVSAEVKDQRQREQKTSAGVTRGLTSFESAPVLHAGTAAMAYADYRPETAGKALIADEMKRSQTYNPPRTITLNTKFDGAVTIELWNGYAVLVVGANGERRVAKGPAKILLAYDEKLEPQSFSTGKPKTTDRLYVTPYLKFQHNQVGDRFTVTTSDLVKVALTVSYRVNFEGDPLLWFAVENYVKFLCDRMRSMLDSVARKIGIEQLIGDSHALVRDTILGAKTEDGKQRPGRFFPENGMRVYDVELLKIEVSDGTDRNTNIIDQLTAAQHAAVANALKLKQREAELQTTLREEKIKQDIEFAKISTSDEIEKMKASAAEKKALLAHNSVMSNLALTKEEIEKKSENDLTLLEARIAAADDHFKLATAELEREALRVKAAQDAAKVDQDLQKDLIAAETAAVTARMGAISDKLVAALQTAGDKMLTAEIAKSAAPLAYLKDKSAAEIFGGMAYGLPMIGNVLKGALANGKTEKALSSS